MQLTWREFWHDRPTYQKIGAVVGTILCLFHIYTALFGSFDAFIQRSIHLGLGLILVFIFYTSSKKKNAIAWADVLMIILVISMISYILFRYDYLTTKRFPLISPLTCYEIGLGIVALILVLEATRRVISKGLFFITLAFIIYPFIAPYLPGVLYATPIKYTKLLDFNYLSMGGIFGIPLGVSATDIALFIIFGSILMRSGGSHLISNLSTIISGRAVGGPAKVAVVASSLMGTISGSGTANVATTGSVTIPMMKRAGYRPEFAASVEAVASTGGQLMPPIMGAAAFVMSAFSGIPYHEIILYALFPAILYYMSLFISVDLEARRFKLASLPPDFTLKETLRDYGHMIIPIVVLVYTLVAGYTPRMAGGLGIVTALVACQFRTKTRLNLPAALSALENGAKSMLIVIISCAAAGIIVGTVDLTGIGQRLGTAFVYLASGNLILALILGMFVALLLGLGLPTTPAYIVQVATVIPALVLLGLPIPAAHLFAFYYSCLSIITPPVAAASYTASAIADSDGWKTGWLGAKLAIVAYIIPFMFAFDQSLLLIGSFWEVFLSVITASFGVFILAVSCSGFLKRLLTWPERAIAFCAAILLIVPNWRFSAGGAVLALIIIGLQFWTMGRGVKEKKEFRKPYGNMSRP